MKFISILFFLIFSTTLYAQAEEPKPQSESQPQTERTLQNEPMPEKENTGFFYINLGGEVIPADNFEYHTSVVGIHFGGLISQQNAFRAGLKITTAKVEHSFLSFQYEYSFTDSSQWILGIDAALLVGFKSEYNKEKEEDIYTIGGGFELGPYLRAFISKSHALLLRAGVTYDTSTDDEFDLNNSRAYLNLGIQWYF